MPPKRCLFVPSALVSLWLRCLLAGAMGLCVLPASSADAPPAAARADERAALEAERKRLDAQLAADLADCAGRFAVTACKDAARERHRAAQAGPRARVLALEDADRQARAQARRDGVMKKQQRLAAASAPAASAAGVQAPGAAASAR